MVVSIRKEQILAEFTNEHTVTAVTWGLHAASMSTDLKMVLSMTCAQHFIWYSQGFRNTSTIKKKKWGEWKWEAEQLSRVDCVKDATSSKHLPGARLLCLPLVDQITLLSPLPKKSVLWQ